MTKRVAVLGFGITGASVVRHLLRRGVEPVVLDTRAARPGDNQEVEFLWDATHWPGLDVDVAIVSPGLDLDSALVAEARSAGVELLSDIDLFFASVSEPVIAITGTNGKSTVTSLAGHLLSSAGISCGVGGNLGEAALDIIDPDHQCYVLELSSFQLERSAEHAFHCATILNISEDHLDKHGDLAGYAAAKQRICSAAASCVYNRADPLTLLAGCANPVSFGADAPPTAVDWGIREDAGERYFAHGDELICPTSQFSLSGAHNEQNALAACAVVDGWFAANKISTALASFAGLAHRFEAVAQIAGVSYVDDSKATNLGATVAALGGMPAANQVVLIAGGDAKGVDLSPLLSLLRGRVKQLVTLGQDGPQLMQLAAKADIPAVACSGMVEVVAAARGAASTGDTVLLSPACSSLDMFSGFAERGNQFAAAVRDLDEAVC